MRTLGAALVAVLLLVGCQAAQPSAPEASQTAGGGASSATAGPTTAGPTSGAPPGSQPPTGAPSEVPVGTATEVPGGEDIQVEPPVPIESTVEASGLAVHIVAMTAITTVARIPGEVAGPGLAIQLELINNSTEPIEIDSLVVTLYDSAEAPAGMITSDSDAPRGVVGPGESMSGVFRYTIPIESRQPVTIEVSLPNHPNLLTFRGDAPTG